MWIQLVSSFNGNIYTAKKENNKKIRNETSQKVFQFVWKDETMEAIIRGLDINTKGN